MDRRIQSAFFSILKKYLGTGWCGPLDAGVPILWCLRKKMREKFRGVRG